MHTDTKRASELTDEILIHLRTVGPKQWSTVREKFPEFSNATFWRKVKAGRNHAADTDASAGTAKGETEPMQPNSEKPEGTVGYYKHLNQALRLSKLFADAAELKRQSVDKNGNITNAAMFSKSITIREKLLNSELYLLERHHDIGNMEAFFQIIIDTIAAESPEVRDRIIEALTILNNSRKPVSDGS